MPRKAPRKTPHQAPRKVSSIDVHIGELITRARKLKNITQMQTAQACGVTHQQIQKYEKGTNKLSPARIVQLCNLYDITVASMFEGAPGYKVGK